MSEKLISFVDLSYLLIDFLVFDFELSNSATSFRTFHTSHHYTKNSR